MSIFDVIRYPLSHPPTAEELSRLPEDLFEKWVFNSDWSGLGHGPAWIGRWYRDVNSGTGLSNRIDLEDLRRLKQMIKDYDSNEPI